MTLEGAPHLSRGISECLPEDVSNRPPSPIHASLKTRLSLGTRAHGCSSFTVALVARMSTIARSRSVTSLSLGRALFDLVPQSSPQLTCPPTGRL